MRKLFFACFMLLSFVTIAQSKKDNRFAGLDTAFSRVLKEWKAPGFAVAVVEKNKVVYAKGFGYKDFENKIPVTVHTQFAIGSCTKAFTASILGILRKDGKINFDSAVINYIPELRFSSDELSMQVTIKDMLSHRTGLPRYDYSWYLWPSGSEDSLIKRVRYMEPTFPLRVQWQYNNWMYFLLGVTGERLNGKSWHENIREHFFKPIGMTESNTNKKDHELYKDIAFGYGLKDDSLIYKMDFYNIAGMAPAGSINSTVTDMAKWLTVWINGGKYQNAEIIPGSYIQEAESSQMVIGGALPQKETPDLYMANYGYGWMLSSYRGHYRVEHGGNIDGFSASTSFFPSDSIGIVVLANQNASSVPSIVRNIIADRMLKLKPKDWQTTSKKAADKNREEAKKAQKAKSDNRKMGTRPSHSIGDYTGSYSNPAFGSFTISLNKDSLMATAGSKELYLRHYHYDVFEGFLKDEKFGIDTSDGVKMQFYMDESGDIRGLNTQLEASLPPMDFAKMVTTQTLPKDSLQQYTGTYDLGMEIKVIIRNDSTLFMIVPGQPDYELQYVGKDRFALKILSGYYVQFKRDENGKIIAAISQQPNGNFEAKKKN